MTKINVTSGPAFDQSSGGVQQASSKPEDHRSPPNSKLPRLPKGSNDNKYAIAEAKKHRIQIERLTRKGSPEPKSPKNEVPPVPILDYDSDTDPDMTNDMKRSAKNENGNEKGKSATNKLINAFPMPLGQAPLDENHIVKKTVVLGDPNGNNGPNTNGAISTQQISTNQNQSINASSAVKTNQSSETETKRSGFMSKFKLPLKKPVTQAPPATIGLDTFCTTLNKKNIDARALQEVKDVMDGKRVKATAQILTEHAATSSAQGASENILGIQHIAHLLRDSFTQNQAAHNVHASARGAIFVAKLVEYCADDVTPPAIGVITREMAFWHRAKHKLVDYHNMPEKEFVKQRNEFWSELKKVEADEQRKDAVYQKLGTKKWPQDLIDELKKTAFTSAFSPEQKIEYFNDIDRGRSGMRYQYNFDTALKETNEPGGDARALTKNDAKACGDWLSHYLGQAIEQMKG